MRYNYWKMVGSLHPPTRRQHSLLIAVCTRCWGKLQLGSDQKHTNYLIRKLVAGGKSGKFGACPEVWVRGIPPPHHACNLSTAAPPMAVVETEFGLAREFYWCQSWSPLQCSAVQGAAPLGITITIHHRDVLEEEIFPAYPPSSAVLVSVNRGRDNSVKLTPSVTRASAQPAGVCSHLNTGAIRPAVLYLYHWLMMY